MTEPGILNTSDIFYYHVLLESKPAPFLYGKHELNGDAGIRKGGFCSKERVSICRGALVTSAQLTPFAENELRECTNKVVMVNSSLGTQ